MLSAALLLIASVISIPTYLSWRRMLFQNQRNHDLDRNTYEIIHPSNLSQDHVRDYAHAIGNSLNNGIAKFGGVPTISFETWASDRGISHRLRVPAMDAEYLVDQLDVHLPGIDITPLDNVNEPGQAVEFTFGVELFMTDSLRPLRISNPKAHSAKILRALHTDQPDETVVLQWIISHTTKVKSSGNGKQASTGRPTFLQALVFGTEPSKVEVSDRQTKAVELQFAAVGRIAAVAEDEKRAKQLVMKALRALQSENHENKIYGKPIKHSELSVAMNDARTPVRFGNQLSVSELISLIAWPIGDPQIPGLKQGSARRIAPTESIARSGGRNLGWSNIQGKPRPVHLSYDFTDLNSIYAGMIGCLHPDTIIFDPIDGTTKTVKQRFDDGLPFSVFAKHGQKLVVAHADAPVAFRKVGMYRLYNDEHEVVVTGEHKVWNGRAYVEVASLYSLQQDEPVHLPTISDGDLSKLQQDAQHLIRTRADFLSDYRSSRRLYDQQPRRGQGSGRACVQQQAGAHEPCLNSYGVDVQENRLGHTRLYQYGLPLPARNSYSSQSLRVDAASPVPSRGHYGSSSPIHPGDPLSSYSSTAQSHIASEPLSVVHPLTLSSSELLFNDYFHSKQFWVQKEEDETYYDFHVPYYENYLAEGLIHHNSGKSVGMANAFYDDVHGGYGAIVIDASASRSPQSLASRAIDYIPHDRVNEVIFVDVQGNAEHPIGFNLFDQGLGLGAIDQIVGVFTSLYPDIAQGVSVRDLLHHGLWTLINHGDLTLVDLGALIRPKNSVEAAWADDVIKGVTDPDLKDFWERMAKTGRGNERKASEWERYTDPLYRRLWQLMGRPEIRNMIGQTRSALNWEDVLTNNKKVIISLSGLPRDSAELLGSLLTQTLWSTAQRLTPARGNALYLDEFQITSNIKEGLDDMLNRGRKHKLWTQLGTQFLSDLPAKTKNAIYNNVGSRIIYRTSADEALMWRRQFASDLLKESDFQQARPHEAIIQIPTESGRQIATIKARPPAEPTGTANQVMWHALHSYGKPVEEVRQEIIERRKPVAAAPRNEPNIGWES